MRIHHAGVATDDATALAERFAALLDTPVVHEERLDDLRVVFLDADGSFVELLEPTGDGTVARYLDREGPGIHHLAFATADVDAALARARELGIEPIDEEPRAGAWGHEVAFLHPRDTGGVLVEFVATHD